MQGRRVGVSHHAAVLSQPNTVQRLAEDALVELRVPNGGGRAPAVHCGRSATILISGESPGGFARIYRRVGAAGMSGWSSLPDDGSMCSQGEPQTNNIGQEQEGGGNPSIRLDGLFVEVIAIVGRRLRKGASATLGIIWVAPREAGATTELILQHL